MLYQWPQFSITYASFYSSIHQALPSLRSLTSFASLFLVGASQSADKRIHIRASVHTDTRTKDSPFRFRSLLLLSYSVWVPIFRSFPFLPLRYSCTYPLVRRILLYSLLLAHPFFTRHRYVSSFDLRPHFISVPLYLSVQ